MAKWLRIVTYLIAGGGGLVGAMLGYSKPATMAVILAVVISIEGFNYLARRRKGDSA